MAIPDVHPPLSNVQAEPTGKFRRGITYNAEVFIVYLAVAIDVFKLWHARISKLAGGAIGPFSPGNGLGVTSPFGDGQQSPFNPNSKTPFPGQTSRFGPNPAGGQPAAAGVERQTCIL